MCKHKLRNMLKPRTLKMIAFWETGFWPVMCGWIVIMFTKRESEDEFALDSEEHQLIIHQHNEDWEKGGLIYMSCFPKVIRLITFCTPTSFTRFLKNINRMTLRA